MKYTFFFVIILLLTGAGFLASGVKLDRFDVQKEDNNLVISWQVSQEAEVREYELQRATEASNRQFVKIAAMRPHGPEKAYRYLDDQVFKTASQQVEYRLEAVYVNGLREQLGKKSVSYTPTAVRRTWGSIKAMFQ